MKNSVLPNEARFLNQVGKDLVSDFLNWRTRPHNLMRIFSVDPISFESSDWIFCSFDRFRIRRSWKFAYLCINFPYFVPRPLNARSWCLRFVEHNWSLVWSICAGTWRRPSISILFLLLKYPLFRCGCHFSSSESLRLSDLKLSVGKLRGPLGWDNWGSIAQEANVRLNRYSSIVIIGERFSWNCHRQRLIYPVELHRWSSGRFPSPEMQYRPGNGPLSCKLLKNYLYKLYSLHLLHPGESDCITLFREDELITVLLALPGKKILKQPC